MMSERFNAVGVLLLVGVFLAVANCGGDDDDASAGSGGSSGTAGSGGTGGASGSAGTAEDLTAQCIDTENERNPDLVDCNECLCENCLEELNDCVDDQGCWNITDCYYEKECTLASRYLPDTCQEVTDSAGGPTSESVGLAKAFGECLVDTACPCPGVPASGDKLTISGVVVEATPISEKPRDERPPLEGVEICVYENEYICTTTDGNGEFTLEEVPADTDVYLSFRGAETPCQG